MACLMLRAFASGDEDAGGVLASRDVGSVPDARIVDGIVAGGKGDADFLPVWVLLDQRHGACGADDHFCAFGMHFPTVPAFRKAVLRHQPSLRAIGGVAGTVGGIPLHASEGRFNGGCCAKAEVDGRGGEVGHEWDSHSRRAGVWRTILTAACIADGERSEEPTTEL